MEITQIPYVYKDANGYGQQSDIYLAGSLSRQVVKDIKAKLNDGTDFIPYDLGLGIEELQGRMSSAPNIDSDHPFHELLIEERTLLPEAPEGAQVIAVDDFVRAFSNIANKDGWDEPSAMRRLGLADSEGEAP